LSVTNKILSEHKLRLNWVNTTDDFVYENYEREHEVVLENGQALKVSAHHHYFGNEALMNPEDALLLAAASCHMLSFLAVAARKRWHVLSYKGESIAYLDKNLGPAAISKIVLKPEVTFAEQPSEEAYKKAHHSAHRQCFIANSLKSEIEIIL
jgi:organic hydroperoxide reductase OsmC/OhrA